MSESIVQSRAQMEVSSEYLLPQSAADLPPINDYSPFNSNLRQVPCQRTATGLVFGNGSQRYQWSVSPTERCPINEAYFRIRASLYAACPQTINGAGVITSWKWGAPMRSYAKQMSFGAGADANPAFNDLRGHDIAFSENVCANAFTQMNVKINNIIFSQVQNYLPQIDMLVQRLTTSYTSQKANKYANLVGMSLRERIDYVSSNASVNYGYTVSAAGAIDGYEPAGVLSTPLTFGTDTMITNPSSTTFTPNFGAAIGNVTPGAHVEFIWRPYACSAFNCDKYLMAGNYEVELLPAPFWYVQMLESIQHIAPSNIYICGVDSAPTVNAAPGLYGIGIDDIQFFVPVIASPQYLDDLSFYLSFTEYEIQGKQLGNGSSNTLVYTIPWSTQCIANVLQTNLVGQTTLCPPSKFLNVRAGTDGTLNSLSVLDINSNNINTIQITYGKVYPLNNYTSRSSNVAGIQNFYQRYYDTFSNSKALWETGCQEPFIDNSYPLQTFCPMDANPQQSRVVPVYGFSNADFVSRGAIYCVSVAKPQESKITQLTLVIQYNSDPFNSENVAGAGLATSGSPQTLIMSAYKKTVKVTIANSVCVGVEVSEG